LGGTPLFDYTIIDDPKHNWLYLFERFFLGLRFPLPYLGAASIMLRLAAADLSGCRSQWVFDRFRMSRNDCVQNARMARPAASAYHDSSKLSLEPVRRTSANGAVSQKPL